MSLSLNSLKASPKSRKRVKRIGRGNASGHGTSATRGTKGQRARQGGRKGLGQFGVKHFVSHLPKVRGFQSFKDQLQVVNVADLKVFVKSVEVTNKMLKSKGLIKSLTAPVKLIGQAKLTVALTLKVTAATAGAKKSVTEAGGQVVVA